MPIHLLEQSYTTIVSRVSWRDLRHKILAVTLKMNCLMNSLVTLASFAQEAGVCRRLVG